MERRKLTKEDIDKVRNIEGFPIGTDEDIIALSDAPHYTACPNPFIEEFIKENGTPYDETTDDYHREPLSSDVAEDKHDLIYNIHSYHTKVPPKAIMHYIDHYTNPGDIVLDAFCGTGMTGIAAQLCKNKRQELQQRKPIVLDLSGIAGFIAGNYNSPIEYKDLVIIEKAISTLKTKFGKYYETSHSAGDQNLFTFDNSPMIGEINYVVWSDIFVCPQCSSEFNFYDVAVDSNNKTRKEFLCPNCNAKLTKASCTRAVDYEYDEYDRKSYPVTKSVPVLINYSVGNTRYNKKPDKEDLKKINEFSSYPMDLPNVFSSVEKGDKTGELIHGNVRKVPQLYRKRTLHTINEYWHAVSYNNKGLFLLTSTLPKLTILNRFMPEHGSRALVGPMAGTFYLPALSVENNVIHQLEFQLKKLKNLQYCEIDHIVSTQSACDLSNIPDNAIDYIFVDPPFGANIMYSELNSVSESWLRIKTNNNSEAIMNSSQNKGLSEYQRLMTSAFLELFRVLKPNRWITVEFHNSKNSVWKTIQEALGVSGFIIADVRVLNKEKKTINQYNASGAVDQDLIISAYKPKSLFVKQFNIKAGTEEAAWEFVRQHLSNVPVVVNNTGKIETVVERQAILLFDRMVAYHIVNGVSVPLDAADFYKGLDERFIKRDGMYFLSSQVNEYDEARSISELEDVQLSMFVCDERTAIGWLYNQLVEPQTYQVLQPKFMQEVKSIDKHEKMPELMTILEENFLKDDGGKWYIPDLSKSGDVAKLREKNLLKEFQTYLTTTGKLKVFRLEAIRAGFAKLWKEKGYETIVKLAERLPEETVQEDSNLLMYYDISLSRFK